MYLSYYSMLLTYIWNNIWNNMARHPRWKVMWSLLQCILCTCRACWRRLSATQFSRFPSSYNKYQRFIWKWFKTSLCNRLWHSHIQYFNIRKRYNSCTSKNMVQRLYHIWSSWKAKNKSGLLCKLWIHGYIQSKEK